MKGLIISANKFEDTELLYPYYRLQEEGIDFDLASMETGKIKGKHGYRATVHKKLNNVHPEDYDFLILPGGKAPAKIRKQEEALEITQHFFAENKPVAAICHGPQILISAELMEGRNATCYQSVAKELKKAGATYKDKKVVVDGNLITSRQPKDLPAFMRELLKKIKGRAVADER